MRKIIKLSLFCAGISSILQFPVNAQIVDVPLAGKLDLGKFVAIARADYVYDRSNMRLAGAHIPLATLHDSAGKEYVNLNGGMCWDTNRGIGGPFVAVGGRLDNIIAKIGQNEKVKNHVAVIGLPPIELGPFGGYVANIGWLWGGFISMGLGGSK